MEEILRAGRSYKVALKLQELRCEMKPARFAIPFYEGPHLFTVYVIQGSRRHGNTLTLSKSCGTTTFYEYGCNTQWISEGSEESGETCRRSLGQNTHGGHH